MIEFAEFEEFRYCEPQWSELKAVALDARLDVDQITRRIMEFAVSAYSSAKDDHPSATEPR
jgi:hypothetical protein